MPNNDIRPLMQNLGSAINDTLTQSDLIGEAIEEIRRAGYDVFLVLEATIGFNRREDAPNEQPPAEMHEPTPLVDDAGHVAPKTFGGQGSQDQRFLRALKISLPPD